MKLELDISEFAEKIFLAEGVVDMGAFLSTLIDKEALRLYHVHRSRPKPPELVKPVGRPRQTPAQKRVKELGDILREVYLKQREFYGDEYEQHFGEQERILEAAIEAENLEVLMEFQTTQPWIRRKKNV